MHATRTSNESTALRTRRFLLRLPPPVVLPTSRNNTALSQRRSRGPVAWGKTCASSAVGKASQEEQLLSERESCLYTSYKWGTKPNPDCRFKRDKKLRVRGVFLPPPPNHIFISPPWPAHTTGPAPPCRCTFPSTFIVATARYIRRSARVERASRRSWPGGIGDLLD